MKNTSFRRERAELYETYAGDIGRLSNGESNLSSMEMKALLCEYKFLGGVRQE